MLVIGCGWVDPVFVVDHLTAVSMKMTFSSYIGTPFVYMDVPLGPTVKGSHFDRKI